MTLKFESEILFDLMKRDGDDAPSDVLPYESELKEKYLNQVVGAYPKLQDYRPEWLNYNLYHHLPSDFPTESVTNVTNASFHNVVPYSYRSAILSGNTLVNLASPHNEKEIVFNSRYTAYNVTNDVCKGGLIHGELIYISCEVNIGEINIPNSNFGAGTCRGTGGHDLMLKTCDELNTFPKNTWVKISGIRQVEDTESLDQYTLWFGQRGEHPTIAGEQIARVSFRKPIWVNLTKAYGAGAEPTKEECDNIPYFEGMCSVKMPVLTTTGKNLFDGIMTSGQLLDNNVIQNNITKMGYSEFLRIEEELDIYCSYYTNSNYVIEKIYFYNENKNQIGTKARPTKVASPKGAKYFRLSITTTDWSSNVVFNDIKDDFNIQVETGIQATSYEPYKSNILSTPEDVTLRGIGKVQDTLDCLTGEVVERVGEIVLDGSENWIYEPTYTNENVYGCYIPLHQLSQPPKPSNFNFANNVFPNITNSSYQSEGFATNPGVLSLRIAKSKLESADLSGFKKYLQNHPVTLQYPLATESIKTVDLTCINEQGESETLRPIEGTMHVNTSSQTLLPLLDMSVPVEATSQNLMSFANIEEEEK